MRGEKQVECTKRNDEFRSLTISGFLLFIICNKTFNNNDGDNDDQAVCSALHPYALNCLYIFVLCAFSSKTPGRTSADGWTIARRLCRASCRPTNSQTS